MAAFLYRRPIKGALEQGALGIKRLERLAGLWIVQHLLNEGSRCRRGALGAGCGLFKPGDGIDECRRRLLCRLGAKGLACGHQFRHLEAVGLDGDVDTIATDLTNQTLE
jgi:hypothetical protein